MAGSGNGPTSQGSGSDARSPMMRRFSPRIRCVNQSGEGKDETPGADRTATGLARDTAETIAIR
jgi:hypothetical protein